MHLSNKFVLILFGFVSWKLFDILEGRTHKFYVQKCLIEWVLISMFKNIMMTNIWQQYNTWVCGTSYKNGMFVHGTLENLIHTMSLYDYSP